MPSRNGTVAEHADPTGIIGRIGAEVSLGDLRVRVRMLKNREIKEQMSIIGRFDLVVEEETLGAQLYGAVARDGGWEALANWLAFWVDPAPTVDQLLDCYAEELIAFLDVLFEQSGLGWLRRSLGNRVRLLRAMTEEQIATALLQMSAQTSSTNSSSESADPPPTPVSLTPVID